MNYARLIASVLTNKDIGDCTNNGLTSKFDSVVLYWNKEDLFQEPDLSGVELEPNALIVKADTICGDKTTIRAFLPNKPEGAVMCGGNFVYTSDSRMPKIGDFSAPISVHDRVESWEQYRRFSD